MLSFSGGQRVGQKKGLSSTDVDKLHTVYRTVQRSQSSGQLYTGRFASSEYDED